MKLILLFGLLFMVSCQQQELEEALMSEPGDTVEKSILNIPPVGVEIFDTFDISGNPDFLNDNSTYRRCDIDPSGLYKQVTIFTSQDNVSASQLNMAVLVYYRNGGCMGVVEYNHNYEMRISVDNNVAYVDNFSFRVMNMGSNFGANDDCDYSESIIDTNCYHDFKSFQHDLVVIDESTISLDGKVYSN